MISQCFAIFGHDHHAWAASRQWQAVVTDSGHASVEHATITTDRDQATGRRQSPQEGPTARQSAGLQDTGQAAPAHTM
ncbi:hypothetical protein [Bradyrhizobium lablabi]|uniref:hypothetical protein n=1 Tax=Bradyrhizobium lablabi TaxID=722472 RepID=UPI001BA701E0|nr:hypothetical protein [Bradyrhizobium lablabi]MBR0697011.1 hypothetical protein [Bradyrhizobium lablabi]